MYLSDLALDDFRNYRQAVAAFSPGVNILVGANGQGKTNLVEAVGYLATLSSHRVSADAALVRAGSGGAVIRAKVIDGGRPQLLEVEIVAGKANRARLNRAPARPRDLLGIVRAVVFAPEDLALVKGDPSDRRRFLDELVVGRTPRLAAVRAEYDKILRQRSALLKQSGGRRRGEYVDSTLDVWDAQLAAAGAQIVVARAGVIRDVGPLLAAAYGAVADGSDRTASAELQSSLAKEEARAAGTDPAGDVDGATTAAAPPGDDDVAAVAARLEAQMRRLRPAELDRGVCLVGPHRDELALTIGDLPAKGYASHGESWSLALALRIASFELLRADGEGTPILILDDVFAELDARRRAALAGVIAEADQVFITAAVGADVPDEIAGRRFRVEAGTIEEAA